MQVNFMKKYRKIFLKIKYVFTKVKIYDILKKL